MVYKIDLLNSICTDNLGGTGGHVQNITALNEWCVLAGGTGGHRFDISAYNELSTLYGGTGGYKYDIDALNEICVLSGGTGGHRFAVDALVELGALLNLLPVIPDGTPTSTFDVTDTAFKVISSVSTNSSTIVELEYGTATGVYPNKVTAAESPITATGDVNFALTGLSPYTDYYFRVKAVNSAGTAYSQEFVQRTIFNATLTATGTGAGVSTLRLEVSENQTLTITSGNARFYTDAAGTLGESTTWNVTTGALRTIYLKAPSGDSVLNIQKPDKVTKWGNSITDGWTSSTNAPRISIEVGKLALTELRITGTSTLTGALPTGLTYLYLLGTNSINWTYTGALPTGLTFLLLQGRSINWTYTGALPTGLTYLYLQENSINWTYTGALPTGLTFLYLNSSSIAWTYTGALPTGLTYLILSGNSIAWTGLDVGNSGNIGTFNLANYRIAKMSSIDMVTLLTQLTNRTGSLPATITINDYADYASPPAEVTAAVAALKAAKPNISTVNLGA